MLTRQKHTGLTWLQGEKGGKRFRAATVPGVRPQTPPCTACPQNAPQCMQDCARGILFNDRLIYIF